MNWTPVQVLAKLGVPWPETEDGVASVVELAIDLLKTDNQSGYHHVFKGASNTNPWQAKPYVRPKVQRNLGSFATARDAARQVVKWLFEIIPTPPSPLQDRNARGAGRKKRDRRKGELCLHSVLPLALLTTHSLCSQMGQIDGRASSARSGRQKSRRARGR